MEYENKNLLKQKSPQCHFNNDVLVRSGKSGDIDHLIPEQIDHPLSVSN
jgi:hypothetical protein